MHQTTKNAAGEGTRSRASDEPESAVLADIRRTTEAKRDTIAALFGSAPTEPTGAAPKTGTCSACEEPVEFYEGIGWVEIARDGHYDLCPERYIEATDTQRGHAV